MATLNNNSSGNFTSAATWSLVDSATLSDSEASSGSAGTAWTGAAAATTFTPGALVSDGIGVKLLNKSNAATGTFSVRVVPQGSITSVSIANPTTITTSVAHGLSTGDTVTIAGTTTTPTTTGSFTVTVTGANTFTIPVNVTAVTTGTGTWTRNVAVISSNSVAASTVITTTSSHGLTSGASVTISGNKGSVPSINGTYTITVLSTTTFSIPVTTTVAGTGGVFHINSGSPNTTVSIDVADLPTPGTGNAGSCSGWFFFKFPSTVTFNAGTGYAVQIYCTTNAGVTAYTNGTTAVWSRFLRTTTTQAPVAGDVLYVTGDYTAPSTANTYTVTMDNTASTIFGKLEISGKGLLAYGSASSTNYQLICNGDVRVNGAGELWIGTSGSRLPASSTAVLQINQGGVNVTNGLLLRGTGFVQTWGNNKVWRTTLATTVAVGAVTLTSTDTTGWSSGEDVVIASTTRTAAQTELRTLSGVSGTTLTVPALTFAHDGAGDTQAELANITRNIKIRGESTTIQAYVNVQADSILNSNDTEYQFLGSATANKRGFDVLVITGSVGAFTLKDCALKNFEVASSIAVLLNQATNTACTIDGCVLYRVATGIQTGATTTNGITINNCWGFGGTLGSILFNLSMQAGTFTNCRAVSSTSSGITISNLDNLGLTVSGLIAHSNATAGISLTMISNSDAYHSVSNLTSWRNTTRGVFFTGSLRLMADTISAFGNVTDGIEFNGCYLVDVNNAVLNGGTTLVQPYGILFGASNTGITVNNTTIGQTSLHATGSVLVNTARQRHDVSFRNCLFTESTEVASQTNMTAGSYIGSSKHDQTTGIHKMWKKLGNISSDNTLVANSPLSVRYTPANASFKTVSMERRVAIPSGKTAKITVAVRRSVAGDGTAYNGNLPRLIVKENTAAGISSDTVLATATGASLGAFELLTATTSAVLNDTELTFVLDCDGTTGWVNSDNWKIDIIGGTALSNNVNGEDYWVDGYSAPGVNTTLINNSGLDTYWADGMPAMDLFPISNSQTGRFLLLFD